MKKRGSSRSISSAKYTGELASPLIGPSSLASFFGGDAQAAQKFRDHLSEAKFRLLFEHYSINPEAPDAWKQLARALAHDHVPGMSVRAGAKKRGRPRSWADGLYPKLLRAVADLRDRTMTTEEALNALLQHAEWRSYTKANLKARYTEAKRLEQEYRRLHRELKARPFGLESTLLKAFNVDPSGDLLRLRSEGFELDEN